MYLFFIFILYFQLNIALSSTLKERYPKLMLTNDYGILSVADILYEIKSESIPSGYSWQCVPRKDVRFTYSVWDDIDYTEDKEIKIKMCEFRILLKLNNFLHRYFVSKAGDVEQCRILHRDWKKVTSDQKYICVNGHFFAQEAHSMAWDWNKVKTKKGCISWFEGKCETNKVYEKVLKK